VCLLGLARDSVDLDLPLQFPYCCHEVKIVAGGKAKVYGVFAERVLAHGEPGERVFTHNSSPGAQIQWRVSWS